MTTSVTRTFETRTASRCQVPLLIGLMSPSGAGKTFSALRLASGIQRVVGGDIHVLDTEQLRALHYADRFKFKHTAFKAPFGPLDYLAGIEHCVSQGANTIIIDSASHEHEGPGGVLEIHEQEIERMVDSWKTSREKVQLGAWAKPKQERRRLINTMVQLPCNFILCFRSKKKLKIERGKEPQELGWMPIAGDEWLFEMTMNCLLLPGANGVPTWDPTGIGEREMVKLPEQFRPLMLEKNAGKPLNEDVGQALSVWAAGDAASASDADHAAALDSITGAATGPELKKIAEGLRSKAWSNEQREQIASALEAAKAKIAGRAA
jgi:hypothetical protein